MARKAKTKAKGNSRGGKVQTKAAPVTPTDELCELMIGHAIGGVLFSLHGALAKGHMRIARVLEHAGDGYAAAYDPELKQRLEERTQTLEREIKRAGKAKVA